jgi:hypothetical protein
MLLESAPVCRLYSANNAQLVTIVQWIMMGLASAESKNKQFHSLCTCYNEIQARNMKTWSDCRLHYITILLTQKISKWRTMQMSGSCTWKQELAQRINSTEIIALPVERDRIQAQVTVTVKREAPCSSKTFVIWSTCKAHHHKNKVQLHFIQIWKNMI